MRIEAGSAEHRSILAGGKVIRVFLGDEEVSKYCVRASEEEGVAEVCVVDGQGQVQVDPNDRGRVWTEERRGIVRIQIEDK